MRQHLTFSVLTDGLGTFVRNMIKDIFHKNAFIRNKKVKDA